MNKITKFLSLGLAGALVVALTACGGGDKAELVMATEAGFAPYEYYEGQEIVGVDVDIAKEIAKDLDKELVIKDIAFDAIINEVKTGKADFGAAGMTITEERKEEVDFTIEYAVSEQVVLVKKGSTKLSTPQDIEKLAGLKVGVQLSTTADLVLSDTEAYPNLTLTQQKKYLALVEDLKNDKIDCIVMDSNPASEIVKANADVVMLDGSLFQDKYGMIVQKGNKELLDAMNKTLQRLVDEGKIVDYTLNHTAK